MLKQLIDCKVGDFIRIYCLGTKQLDENVVKIVNKDSTFWIVVQSKSGREAKFYFNTKCLVVSF